MSAAPPELPGVEHRRVRAGSVELHVAHAGAGAGEPVVLVHGWPQHWWAWRKVIPVLARSHEVFAVDLRGYGWSDAPYSTYAKEELAGDLVALLDALELDRVRLAGHDWGGFVGFLACLRAPERIRSYLALSIMHPWASLPLSLRGFARASYQLVLAAPGAGALIQRRTPFVDVALRKSGPGVWTAEEREVYAERFRDPARAEAASRTYRTFVGRERAAIDSGAYGDRRLTVPSRLLVGRADPVITPERLAGGEDHADDLTIEWVDGGHWLPEERSELVAERIADLP
jgi:pimeloyl-ACP methyl ester carboxylesterase